MSGETFQSFESLGASMQAEARPIFDQFVSDHGLVYAEGVGRYPRLRAEQSRPDGSVAWIELWMGLDEHGQYFTQFRDDLPHELSGGLRVERTEPGGRVRYAKLAAAYTDRPYRDALRTLREDLATLWSTIERFGPDDAYQGRRTVLVRKD
jgi:hypothetical protein